MEKIINGNTFRFWSIHVEFLILFITLFGFFYLLDSKIEQQSLEQHSKIDQMNERINQQNARSDQLYNMFIELVKEKKQS